MFFHNFSSNQVGQQPVLVSIDGGKSTYNHANHSSPTRTTPLKTGVAQTVDRSFNFNGESDLDLEYAMTLTNPQPVLLLQTGDLVEGAGFDNWLDAIDASFCTFEGGDDPEQVRSHMHMQR